MKLFKVKYVRTFQNEKKVDYISFTAKNLSKAKVIAKKKLPENSEIIEIVNI